MTQGALAKTRRSRKEHLKGPSNAELWLELEGLQLDGILGNDQDAVLEIFSSTPVLPILRNLSASSTAYCASLNASCSRTENSLDPLVA